MSPISFPSFIALLDVLKRLLFVVGKPLRGPCQGPSARPQGGQSRRRHSAFFELP